MTRKNALSVSLVVVVPVLVVFAILLINWGFASATEKAPLWTTDLVLTAVLVAIISGGCGVVVARGWRWAAGVIATGMVGLILCVTFFVLMSLRHAYL